MAHMGSFVPAETAELSLIDKIFTRVGASDNISSGESTFMVEMNETASILNNLSSRSLILLDEIGRGTSTYDGISIAWAIAEYLHNNENFKPKTLFATHYHELNQLAESFPRIKNYNVSTKEINNKVVFLRKLIPGECESSFGIHVAQMAGIPSSIVLRANKLLKQLEKKSLTEQEHVSNTLSQQDSETTFQLSFFDETSPIAKEILKKLNDLDVYSMTPIDCMMKLNELKEMIEDSHNK